MEVFAFALDVTLVLTEMVWGSTGVGRNSGFLFTVIGNQAGGLVR